MTAKLPPGFIDTMRAITANEMMPTLAALDQVSRDDLIACTKKLLGMLVQSKTWKPDLLPIRLCIHVNDSEEAKMVLAKLHSLGCDDFPFHIGKRPAVRAIFVDRQGRYSMSFEHDMDLERILGEIARRGDYIVMNAQRALEAESLERLCSTLCST